MKWKVLTKHPLGEDIVDAHFFKVEDGSLKFYNENLHTTIAYAKGHWMEVYEAPE